MVYTMNCEEFLKLVPDFIEDSLEEHHYDGFIRHAKECSDCKDELEVHYMIRVGLNESMRIPRNPLISEVNCKISYYNMKIVQIVFSGIMYIGR